MPKQPSTIRILLAAVVCVGFFGLTWNQLSDAPGKIHLEQNIEPSDNESAPVFALSNDSSGNGLGQPVRGEVITFTFGLSFRFALPPPVFSPAGAVNELNPEAKSASGDSMRNKDPPVS